MTRAAIAIPLLVLVFLGGCAAPENDSAGGGVTASGAPPAPAPQPQPQSQPPTAPPVQPEASQEEAAPASGAVPEAGAPGGVVAANDPSAPPDTPLCGRAAREENGDAAAIASDVMAGGGSCTNTACFDPLTDTFIGADGYRHVCQ